MRFGGNGRRPGIASCGFGAVLARGSIGVNGFWNGTLKGWIGKVGGAANGCGGNGCVGNGTGIGWMNGCPG